MSWEYLRGRACRWALGAFLVAVALALPLWRQQLLFQPVAGALARPIAVTELCVVAGAAATVIALVPRFPLADRLSPRNLEAPAALISSACIVAYGSVPFGFYVAGRLAPGWMPPGAFGLLTDQEVSLAESYSGEVAGSITIAAVIYVSLILAAVALAGPHVGVPVALAVIGAIIIVQVYPGMAWLAFGGAGDPSYQVKPAAAALAITCAACAIALWRRSRGGARALALPDRH